MTIFIPKAALNKANMTGVMALCRVASFQMDERVAPFLRFCLCLLSKYIVCSDLFASDAVLR